MPKIEMRFTRDIELPVVINYEETLMGLDGTEDNDSTVLFKAGEEFTLHEWGWMDQEQLANFESLDAAFFSRCIPDREQQYGDNIVVEHVPYDCYDVLKEFPDS
jgi:hypothetical protein